MQPIPSALESRLFRHYWNDGLIDLFAGIALVALGALWWVDLVAVGAAVPAMLAMLWAPLRRALVAPRAGHVEFSDARTGRNRQLLIGSALLGLLMLAAFVALQASTPARSADLLAVVAPGIPAFLLAVLAAIAGWGLGLPRFLGYAAALCLAGAGVAWADARPEFAMFGAGVLVLASASWRLSRFLKVPVDLAEDGR